MTSSKKYDVVIIGGGPAGSTAATLLAMNGHSVLVLEKAKFPRDHVGESLLPFCYSLFEQLGILDHMKKTYVRKPGVRFLDTDGNHYTTWCFGHVMQGPDSLSFHVPRGVFDQMLLENSRKHGTTVEEETKVTRVDLDDPDGGVEVTAMKAGGATVKYRGRFLLDASGRDTFMANRNGWKKPHPQLDRTALNTHWMGGNQLGGIGEGLLQILYLGGNKQGWIWIIPILEGRLSVGVVLNAAYIREQKEKLLPTHGKQWQMALYKQELMESQFVRNVLDGARIVLPLMVNGNFSYFIDSERKHGQNFALIGDASTFIDPIFASGVYLSMNSARLVADALHMRFTEGEEQGGAAMDRAYAQINGAYKFVNKAIMYFYNPQAINLAQAGYAAPALKNHQYYEDIMALGHYVLAGDFFERHKEYSEFLDTLQDERLFKRYKKFVIERPEFQADTCRVARSSVFPAEPPVLPVMQN
jgi:flavin-dependent dehydrogenase